MDNAMQSASSQWLENHAPGYRNLSHHERQAIFDFVFLWSLFEARILETNANTHLIETRVTQWYNDGTLNADHFVAELEYYRERYINSEAPNDHYTGLNIISGRFNEILLTVLTGQENSHYSRMLCLIIIVWRLRNNLLHGEKWTYEIRDQLENFTVANSILMKLLDSYGDIA
ncbi:hypothetical protein ETAR_14800 [Edwardsiella tarda]